MKPYIVSADIKLLLAAWAAKNPEAIKLPGDDFFQGLRADFSACLRRIFPRFELIGETELVSGVKELVEKWICPPAALSAVPTVALDRVYYPVPDFSINLTRTMGDRQSEIQLRPRQSFSDLDLQIGAIARGIDDLWPERKVVLIDDVIFAGEQIELVTKALAAKNIKVVAVVAGIGIDEGRHRIQALGHYPVNCVRYYSEVIDQICERDFYPGVPFSGRTVAAGPDRNIGMPYLRPFGDPRRWASIGEEHDFSRFCLRQAIKLWQEIERLSGRQLLAKDLPREVAGFDPARRFVSQLKAALDQLDKLSEMFEAVRRNMDRMEQEE
ncbi:MAG: phosphoribosyltransferase [Patescibacteria group bacterium]|jgi:hypothetical protein